MVVELGARSGLIVPVDRGPPLRLVFRSSADHHPRHGRSAAVAATAIVGEDPIRDRKQGSIYALHTVVLPFVFIFNPALLIIDVPG